MVTTKFSVCSKQRSTRRLVAHQSLKWGRRAAQALLWLQNGCAMVSKWLQPCAKGGFTWKSFWTNKWVAGYLRLYEAHVIIRSIDFAFVVTSGWVYDRCKHWNQKQWLRMNCKHWNHKQWLGINFDKWQKMACNLNSRTLIIKMLTNAWSHF